VVLEQDERCQYWTFENNTCHLKAERGERAALADDGVAPPPPLPRVSVDDPGPVSRAFPSWKRSILAEIYLCHACSYHEIEDMETPGQVSAALPPGWAQASDPSSGKVYYYKGARELPDRPTGWLTDCGPLQSVLPKLVAALAAAMRSR
jgi:hypothetical protein